MRIWENVLSLLSKYYWLFYIEISILKTSFKTILQVEVVIVPLSLPANHWRRAEPDAHQYPHRHLLDHLVLVLSKQPHEMFLHVRLHASVEILFWQLHAEFEPNICLAYGVAF